MNAAGAGDKPQPQIQPCRYKVGKTLGAGSYSVVKECVHIDTGRYYAAKVINKRLMAGREHMVRELSSSAVRRAEERGSPVLGDARAMAAELTTAVPPPAGAKRNRGP